MSVVNALRPDSLQRREDAQGVTNIELFFDLVYVFAVTQLSHLLVTHPTVRGAVYAAVLLAMVWQVWVYTTWVVNYLDPGHYSVRLALLVLMAASLVLAAEVPEAFTDRGLLVACLYVGMQLARCAFAVWALRGEALQRTFLRIGAWSTVTGTLVVLGAFADGYLRAGVWALAVAIDLCGGAVGFWTPALGASTTSDWTVSGGHFAERCQAFVLIALGESVVVIGANLAGVHDPGGAEIAAFAGAFAGTAALWWVYFDRTAESSVEQISASEDPGRLARSGFHYVHPLIVAGIIVVSAGDELTLEHPAETTPTPVGWFVLGGTALYLAGHAIFKAVTWRVVSWPRVIGVVVLLALLALAPHVTSLTVGVCALVVVLCVAVADRLSSFPDSARSVDRAAP